MIEGDTLFNGIKKLILYKKLSYNNLITRLVRNFIKNIKLIMCNTFYLNLSEIDKKKILKCYRDI